MASSRSDCVTLVAIGKLSVPLLKAKCREHNICTSGRKADLIKRLHTIIPLIAETEHTSSEPATKKICPDIGSHGTHADHSDNKDTTNRDASSHANQNKVNKGKQ